MYSFLRTTLLVLLFFTPNFIQAQQFTFDRFLKQNKELKAIATNPKHQVQIIYTQINRDKQNNPQFTTYEFQVDSTLYFYPASTVKMPTAFLALQRLNELGIEKETSLRVGADRFIQTAAVKDTSSTSGLPSVAHYIKKIFLVSDNDAFNRLYEFLGQDYINSELRKKGFTNSIIKHRLSVSGYDALENQYANPIWFYNEKGEVIYERQGAKLGFPFKGLHKKKMVRGTGYWSDEEEKIIPEPFDFSQKNFIGLRDLHDMLQRVMFPEAFAPCERFNLTEQDYQFLHQWMSTYPQQSKSPKYSFDDNFVKFLLFGDEEKGFKIPSHIKIYNKPGWAYGFLTDVAYIVDEKNDVEFLLAAQMLVNENEIFNDGNYEFYSVGTPFMGQLGKAIYQYELKRKKAK